MQRTASYFHISKGAVSEAILLGANLMKVKKIKKRRDAVNYLRSKK
jgi:hypothetical protein